MTITERSLVLGAAYVFQFNFRELTGLAVRYADGWVTFRAHGERWSVPIGDVLRRGPEVY